MDISTRRRAITPARLLVAAGLALLVVAVGTAAYPHLTAAATPAGVLTALRATVGFCFVAVLLLPVAALISRLVR